MAINWVETWGDFVERRSSGRVYISDLQVRNYKAYKWASNFAPELLNKPNVSYEELHRGRRQAVLNYLDKRSERSKERTEPIREVKGKKQSTEPFNQPDTDLNAKTRDTLVKNEQANQKQRPYKRKDQQTKRQAQKRAGKPALRINENIKRISNKSKKILAGMKGADVLRRAWSKKWIRRGVYGLGSMLALNMVGKALSRFNPSPAIPEEYDRKYDTIREHLTDFGSPVRLYKTASKTITPYHSTVRRAKVTTTRSVIDKNLALFSHKNAIRHTEY